MLRSEDMMVAEKSHMIQTGETSWRCERRDEAPMSKVITLSDTEFSLLERAAAKSGESPQALIERMIHALADAQGPIYYTDDELLRALGADDEELKELERAVDADE